MVGEGEDHVQSKIMERKYNGKQKAIKGMPVPSREMPEGLALPRAGETPAYKNESYK